MRLSALLVVPLLALGVARAGSPSLNVVSKVEVRDGGGSTVIAIQGSKPPNFTTFSMVDPPRFVIDLSESAFKDVPEDVQVADGTVQALRNISYGSGEAPSIARVMISFDRDVDPPELETVGTTVLVKIAKPSAARAPIAAAEPASNPSRAPAAAAPAPAVAMVAPSVTPAPSADTGDRAKAREVERKAAAEAEAKARAEAEEKAKAEALAKAEAERKAAAEAEAKAKAEAEEKAKAEALAKAEAERKAAAESKARAKAEENAKAEALAKAAAERKAAAESEARAKAEAEASAARAARDEQARAEAEQAARIAAANQAAEREAADRARAAEAAKVASAGARAEPQPAQPPKVEPAQPEPPHPAKDQAPLAARSPANEEVALAAAEPANAPVETAEQARPLEEERPRVAPRHAPRQHIRELGFKVLPEASRVFVRLSDSPRFSIVEAGEKLIRVEMPNATVVRRNDVRFLDTSFFPGAVAMVTPKRLGTTAVLEIALKEKVAYQQRVEGDLLAIDFERPAEVKPNAAPVVPASN